MFGYLVYNSTLHSGGRTLPQSISIFFIFPSFRSFALPSSKYILKLQDEEGDWMCLTAFMTQEIGSHAGLNWVIGDIFLAHFYVEYDLQGKRVGFAHKKKERK